MAHSEKGAPDDLLIDDPPATRHSLGYVRPPAGEMRHDVMIQHIAAVAEILRVLSYGLCVSMRRQTLVSKVVVAPARGI